MKQIEYIKNRMYAGYNLIKDYSVAVPIHPPHDVKTRSGLIHLTAEGVLTVLSGYWWDGPSKPAIQSKNFMRGSLIHDALYGLLRQRQLSSSYRDDADEALREACLEDGMSKLRAWWVYKGVRVGAASAIKYDVLEAP